jgi:hypothetical protein
MTETEFMKFVQEYTSRVIYPTMIGKGLGQYSTPTDRFNNFNQLFHLKKEQKEKCLTDLVGKQIVCLYDVMRLWDGKLTPRLNDLLDELIKDIIIYMFLLRGMFKELEIEARSIDHAGDWKEDWE